MEWKLHYNDGKSWDLKWNDSAITSDFLAKMAPHQNNLAKNLYRMYD
jgi:hypothetical protein